MDWLANIFPVFPNSLNSIFIYLFFFCFIIATFFIVRQIAKSYKNLSQFKLELNGDILTKTTKEVTQSINIEKITDISLRSKLGLDNLNETYPRMGRATRREFIVLLVCSDGSKMQLSESSFRIFPGLREILSQVYSKNPRVKIDTTVKQYIETGKFWLPYEEIKIGKGKINLNYYLLMAGFVAISTLIYLAILILKK